MNPSSPAFSLVLMVLLIAMIYFMMIRPQKKKEKADKEMRDSLRVGDEVIRKEREASGDKVLFFDIPLLFETGTHVDYDAVLVVTADYEIRKARIMVRDGIDSSIIDLIMDSQEGEDRKVRLADNVIYNNGSLDELRKAVDSTLKSYGIE